VDGFAGRIGVHSETAEDGHARLELQAANEHLNPAGTVHGGVLATLVDAAMALAVRSTIDEGEVPATSQLTIAFLNAGQPGALVATATVRKQGKTLLVCEADIDQGDSPLVHAVATFALLH
jgi:uncharacterized protein (TIGR00369 family)